MTFTIAAMLINFVNQQSQENPFNLNHHIRDTLMFVFKFQKSGNLEFNMLRQGEIFFASVAELNDANECRPRFVLNGTKELWIRLAGYILQNAYCFSDEYNRINGEKIQELFSLSRPIGTQLKKKVGNRDVGIEKLDSLFRDALEQELKSRTVSYPVSLILSTTRKVIRQFIPTILEEDKYVCSFSRNAKNPTMWGIMLTLREAS